MVPQNLQDLPPVPAVDLAKALAANELTKFITKLRLWLGCGMILFAVIVFFVGFNKWIAQFFTNGFAEHVWPLTQLLIAGGLAIMGKEIVQGFVDSFKSIKE